ncbi:MAG TPA: 4-hydroxyphenylpyruvate dioxygenase, partial [Acidimicrobiales bacterium]|nr:4-hydroxyphenylpyruvate dioxygenase [Acidimicrobiales bacterium]
RRTCGDMIPATLTRPAPTVAQRVRGWDHIEWWVGNARAVTAWLASGFGFEVIAYRGPETGCPQTVSYALAAGDIRFVVTAGLHPDGEVTRHVLEHGDGIRHLAWRVDDAKGVAAVAAAEGVPVLAEAVIDGGAVGAVTTAAIATYGETRHLLVDRSGWHGGWWPGFSDARLPRPPAGPAVGATAIDHVVGNVERGRLDDWVAFYRDVLGFAEMRHFGADQISTRYSALRSTVVHNGAGVVMPINEPAPGLRKSQIQEYLDAYRGPGVQHIALSTPDIVRSVEAMRARGVRFLDMPDAYYDDVRARLGHLDLDWDGLRRLGIEVDEDSGGYLLQVFTETLGDRPTLFAEIIQREGATGFGEGNFKALFEAIERDQARRGNL